MADCPECNRACPKCAWVIPHGFYFRAGPHEWCARCGTPLELVADAVCVRSARYVKAHVKLHAVQRTLDTRFAWLENDRRPASHAYDTIVLANAAHLAMQRVQ